MGFLDKLRKIFSEREEIKPERVKFGEFEGWLKNKKQQNEDKEKEILNLIKTRVSEFILELEQETSVLEKIDLKDRKAEEKIKLIVMENLLNYIFYLKKLTENLKELEKQQNLDKIIEKINSIFLNFDKKSRLSFEKATFLIGKELGNVKESLSNFLRELKKTLEKNKNVAEISKIFYLVGLKMQEISEIEKSKQETKKIIFEIVEKIKSSDRNISEIRENTEKIKKSPEYEDFLKKKKEIEKKEEELEQDISKIKNMINFKELAKIFHVSEKKMKALKEYNENFKEALERDGGTEIIELINESKTSKSIPDKIREVIKKKEDISKIAPGKDKVDELENEIKKIKSEIHNNESEESEKEKKLSRFEESRSRIINSIREEMKKVNVELTD